jgi:hypothetical protein
LAPSQKRESDLEERVVDSVFLFLFFVFFCGEKGEEGMWFLTPRSHSRQHRADVIRGFASGEDEETLPRRLRTLALCLQIQYHRH